jgi:hypothetical protein
VTLWCPNRSFNLFTAAPDSLVTGVDTERPCEDPCGPGDLQRHGSLPLTFEASLPQCVADRESGSLLTRFTWSNNVTLTPVDPSDPLCLDVVIHSKASS